MMAKTPFFFQSREVVVLQERLSGKKGRFPLLGQARVPPEASSVMLSVFGYCGFTASITLLLPASEPLIQVLNYFKKAEWGDGLRE